MSNHRPRPPSEPKATVLPVNQMLTLSQVRFAAFALVLAGAFYFYGYYFLGGLWRALALWWR